jgi:hypothetical protein
VSSAESLPELEFDLAQFGEAEDHFRVGGFNFRILQLGGILGILVGLGIIALVVSVPIFAAPAQGGRDWPLLIKFGLIGLGALAAGSAAWSRSRSYRGLQILVCTRGLVWMRPDGDEGIPWNSIYSVRRLAQSGQEAGGSLQPNLQLVIQYGAGKQLVLDETLQNLRQLREIVEERTLDHFLAPALEQLRDGAPVPFGKLWVSALGIMHGNQLLPWNRFGHAVAERGEVAVYDRERGKAFCKVNTGEVPNIHVLLALADFFGRSADAESNPNGKMVL